MAGRIEKEFDEINGKQRWNKVYQEIRAKSEREASEKNFSTSESERDKNITLNRYRDVSPYDHSRIIVHRGKTDYINANLVQMERADRKYILTQGPLRDTVGHFWVMVWEQNSKAILMLNKLTEKMLIKCHQYWPPKIGVKQNFSDVGLSVEYLKCEQFTNYCKRVLKLTDIESKKSREIIQFHYTTWPDFGIPSSPVAFLQFLVKVRESGALNSDVGPAVVHCSAGIGRSGTFCLVDICLVLVEKEGETNVSVQDILLELRRYRMGLIQTADQLYFSYQAIIEGIQLLKDSKFTDYEEVPKVVSTDNGGGNDPYDDDILNHEKPPPPIPPRSESLPQKLLPTVTNNDSFSDFNNATNNTSSTTHENTTTNMRDRPLPPVPHRNSLDKVDESHSDDGSESDEYELDDSKNDNDCGNENNNSNNEGNSDKKIVNGVVITGTTTKELKITGAKITEASSELKRRRRNERQANIEQKVNEMKRKQHEAEENDNTKKKRRSIITYLAAGVVVGVLCIYAYSKIG